MLRTLKFALEARTGDVKIGLDHPIIPWMAKHVATRICRYQVRASGRTSYQSIKGYVCRDPVTEFGECVDEQGEATEERACRARGGRDLGGHGPLDQDEHRRHGNRSVPRREGHPEGAE